MGLISRAPGIALIESAMEDQCVIKRDADGYFDDTLDTDTFQLVAPSNDTRTIYSGKCVVATIRTSDREIKNADANKDINSYKVLLPLNAETGSVRIGDIVTVTSATHDPVLEGQSYRVIRVEEATHKVYRYLKVENMRDAIGSVRES